MRPSLFLLSVATGIRIMYCKNDCLRDYQQEMKLRLFEEWELHRSVMVQMPTGTGKTHLLAAIVREFLCGSGSRVWIVAHRRELVEQIEETVSRYGMGREDGSVRVMSIQWLSRNRKIVNGQPDLIVIDEAHHALAETYRELWKSYPEARKLGMTATPCRLNRKGFTDLFDTLITSWSIAEFIGRGWLSSFDYVSIRANSREQRLVDSLKKRGADGDYQGAGASPNSAAIVAGIVRTGSKNEVGITAAFPVTINTAIVSPIARPIPSTTPDVIPEIE